MCVCVWNESPHLPGCVHKIWMNIRRCAAERVLFVYVESLYSVCIYIFVLSALCVCVAAARTESAIKLFMRISFAIWVNRWRWIFYIIIRGRFIILECGRLPWKSAFSVFYIVCRRSPNAPFVTDDLEGLGKLDRGNRFCSQSFTPCLIIMFIKLLTRNS